MGKVLDMDGRIDAALGVDPVQAPAEPTIDSVKAYVALAAEKNAIEDALKGIKSKISDLEDCVLSYLTENAIQSVNVDGYTVYLRRDVRASFRGTPEAFELIEAHELADALVTSINAQRAASIVREMLKGLSVGEELPEWVDGAFSVADRVIPGIRKA